MNQTLKLDTSYKRHFFVAAFIGIWLVLFLVLIAPFDVADLSFKIRLIIIPPYGLITFLGYIIWLPLQNALFHKAKKWTLTYELLFIVLFNCAVILGSYAYYTTDIVNGTYTFPVFLFEVYIPIFFILFIVIVFARWYLNKKGVSKPAEKVTIKGQNKHDLLIIAKTDLIAISSADNYVEVIYLKNGVVTKKLLRNTLKNVAGQLDLLRIHRAHLINPYHFNSWKNANTITVHHLEFPVSKNYKDALIKMNIHP